MRDLSDKHQIRSIVNKYNFTFKKGLGQNFLADEDLFERIASAGKSDAVIEIGPGFGTLTRALSGRYEKVVAIEIDERLIPILENTLSDCENVKIINDDCMKINFRDLINEEFHEKTVSVAANLPYYITTPIITKLLEDRLDLENIVVMVQKEVAQRICASSGGREYGAISVMCAYYAEPEIIADVPAELFVPPPKVDSAVLRLKIRKHPGVDTLDEKMFFRVVRASFAQRRKTLLNALSNAGFGIEKKEIEGVLEKLGIKPSLRGETLGMDEFASIADEFFKIRS